MNYTERKAIESAYYDAWKQTAQSRYNALTPLQARRIDSNGPRGLF